MIYLPEELEKGQPVLMGRFGGEDTIDKRNEVLQGRGAAWSGLLRSHLIQSKRLSRSIYIRRHFEEGKGKRAAMGIQSVGK
jgi:hypothetical protein